MSSKSGIKIGILNNDKQWKSTLKKLGLTRCPICKKKFHLDHRGPRCPFQEPCGHIACRSCSKKDCEQCSIKPNSTSARPKFSASGINIRASKVSHSNLFTPKIVRSKSPKTLESVFQSISEEHSTTGTSKESSANGSSVSDQSFTSSTKLHANSMDQVTAQRVTPHKTDFPPRVSSSGHTAQSFDGHLADVNSYKCDQCDSSFKFLPHLTLHKQAHATLPAGEHKSEAQRQTLKIFQKPQKILPKVNPQSMTKIRRVKCPDCDAILISKKTLNEHKKRKHQASAAYDCSECGKRLPNGYSLKDHRRIHINNRLFECNVPGCLKRFSSRKDVKRHQLIHSGDYPYVCPCCQAKSNRKYNLFRHISVVHCDQPDLLEQCRSMYNKQTNASVQSEDEFQILDPDSAKTACVSVHPALLDTATQRTISTHLLKPTPSSFPETQPTANKKDDTTGSLSDIDPFLCSGYDSLSDNEKLVFNALHDPSTFSAEKAFDSPNSEDQSSYSSLAWTM